LSLSQPRTRRLGVLPGAGPAGPGWARPYAVGALVLLVAYALVAVGLWVNRDFDDTGPLSLHEPERAEPLPGRVQLDEVPDRCWPEDQVKSARIKVVGGQVAGAAYYACYRFNGDSPNETVVVDADRGLIVDDELVLKRGGAWPWVRTYTTRADLLVHGGVLAIVLLLGWAYYRLPRPGLPYDGRPWWCHEALLYPAAPLGVVPLAGLRLIYLLTPWRLRHDFKIRLAYQGALGTVYGWNALMIWTAPPGDTWQLVLGAAGVAVSLWALMAGRRLIAPPGFGAPDPELVPPRRG
jgi:hypothetical protein